MILITGASGLAGSHLTASLLLEGAKLRLMYHSPDSLRFTKYVCGLYGNECLKALERTEIIYGDLLELSFLDVACKEVTQIFHCAAVISHRRKDRKRMYDTNYSGTRNLINAALAAGVKRLIHFSSIATLSAVGENCANEKSSYNPDEDHHYYSYTKYLAEMEIWRATQEGMDALIIHPSVILGETLDNRYLVSLIHKVRNGFRYVTSGSTAVVDVRDLVEMTLRLNEKAAVNSAFVIAGHNLTFFELTRQIANIVSPELRLIKIPNLWVRIAGRIGSALEFLGAKSLINYEVAKSLTTQSCYDSTEAVKATGLRFTPLKESIIRISSVII